ncbi:Glycerophosphodiester phosphodiesterase GDE1 [Sphaceloma murrayae]|uniref:Glycerophosphodiester phosphodiesterase GDE1 n=1 Tax=Sphaceloma murrayae TaxID=2082308 RepID=A0A2K1QIH4_9PEZI|nr:Glycerophosphodiester phosphodiesterase GDE1 [Sphaceloma murrayae]
MKFGQNLTRNQVPEWFSSYINYKGLKKLIKSAKAEEDAEGGADLAEFFYALDRNLEDVDFFYNKKYGEFSRRLRLLYDRYGQTTKIQEEMDKEELEDLMGALLELRSQYRKLQWYGEVNRRGFVKITKKLDKKIAASSAQSRYLATKVDPKPFASNFRLINDMRSINDWLSALAEVKVFDDRSSVTSTGSLQRAASRNAVRVPGATLDSLDVAIKKDAIDQVKELLASIPTDLPGQSWNKLLINLIHRAIICKAFQTITHLLGLAGHLEEEDDMNKRNCIHRYVISVGRNRTLDGQNKPVADDLADPTNFIPAAEFPRPAAGSLKVEERDVDKTLGKADPTIKLLVHILSHLKPEQRIALLARDMHGRLPLHYAAQYGLVAASQELIKHMQEWGQFDVSRGIDSAYWQDAEGYAPLHLSVLGGHYRTTKALLLAENWQHEHDEEIHARSRVDKSGYVLALATKSNFFKIVHLLVEAGVNVNFQDDQGETALHVAARLGHEDCMKALLEIQKPDLELAEKTFGWTPMFVACVDGQEAIVDLLLSTGAEVDKTDLSGWKPIEHASLRGHLRIAKKLTDLTSSTTRESPPLRPVPGNGTASVASSLGDRTSNALIKDSSAARMPEPVKTFGHRYLTEESLVLVSMGSMDARKDVPAVKLENVPLASAHSTQLDTALSIVVSAIGATGEPTIIDLPVQENISTSPITFTSKDPTKVKVLFDIVPTYAGTKDKVLGRGVAMLNTIRPGMGSKRISLQGDLSVPIVAADTLDVIGIANFNFLIITPFAHPNMTITENKTYWKRTSTQIIGHRGLGKNMAAMKSLQLGENTIPSFIAASNLGASYVEFDVQLTKDLVPVIYHDFLVSETGIDAPVHTLTLEQFLHANVGTTPRQSRPSSPVNVVNSKENGVRKGRPHRSYSLGASEEDHRVNMDDRMKHTRDYKQNGFKANSRGNFIQAPFATLEEMFKKLPPNVGFNIEMKYPMLFESEEQEMDTYAVELNSFVDTVLTKVYALGKGRNIIFSSFHPDICLLLSFKQPSIPVLFLSDAGTAPVGDIRASSLQEAIRFASRWNLLGIVSAAEPLVMCPRLVKVVRQSGLLCFSYGSLNNDPENVARQAAEGIDAVIVDNVLAVRKGLTASEQAAAAAVKGAEHVRVEEVKRVEVGKKPNGMVNDKRVDVDGHEQGMVNGAVY